MPEEKEKMVGGGSRQTLHFLWNTMKGKFLFVKVPRQYPSIRLIEEDWREGKTLGSEKGKAIGSRLFGIMVA
jgi:hypothetical protein